MHRLLITVEYDGTDFHGWQLQPQEPTVQGELEKAVHRITAERVRVIGASRTDAGVHAEGQAAHFDTDYALSERRFVPALNYWLPRAVAVLDCCRVSPDFHACSRASTKVYRYRILRSAQRRPLRERHVLREWRQLDPAAMSECASLLVGRHDFTSFASEHTGTRHNVRRLHRSELIERGDELHYLVEGEGFLYNMVRIIVGTMLEVGLGKRTVAEFTQVLQARDRRAAGPTAAARGLTLVTVNYPRDPRRGA